MKKKMKFVGGLILGMSIGFSGAITGIVLFTDTSLATLLEHLNIGSLAGSLFLSFISLILVGYSQIILHEAGHLLFGRLTGYKFISFRIGKLTLIKEKGKYKIKRFKVPGTLGQCLLLPPDVSPQQVPFVLYNLGGVFINLFSAILATVLLIVFDTIHPGLKLVLLLTAFIGLILALLNGIPMKVGGVPNDGYNLKLIWKSIENRKAMISQLKINALAQEGIRLKDMPDEWFVEENDIDYSNVLLVCVRGFCISRRIDKKEFFQAKVLLDEMLLHKGQVLSLFIAEAECESLFLELIGECRPEKIEELYTDTLQKYILRYNKISTGKLRLESALALYREKDHEKARRIYKEACQKRDYFLMKTETEQDIELMEWMLSRET